MKQYLCLNHFIIFYLLIFPIFGRIISGFDAAGRIPLMLIILGLLFNVADSEFKRSFKEKTIIYWCIWTVFAIVNFFWIGVYNGSAYLWTFLSQEFVFPLSTLIFVYYQARFNLKGTIYTIITSLSLFCFLGITMQGLSDITNMDSSERDMGRLGNSLANSGCALAFCVYFAYMRKWISHYMLICICCMVLVAILLVATRKALVAFGLITLFYLLTKVDLHKPGQFVKVLVILFCLYNVASYILDNTMVGVRMGRVEEDSETLTYGYDIPNYLRFLGDRSYHYVLGWQVFCEHPIHGIGIKNIPNFTSLPFPLHSEYMSQLAEGGIIGTSIYFCFMKGFFMSIRNAWYRDKEKHMVLICFGWFVVILFLSFTTWIYDFSYYFAIYGLILGYLNNINNARCNEYVCK